MQKKSASVLGSGTGASIGVKMYSWVGPGAFEPNATISPAASIPTALVQFSGKRQSHQPEGYPGGASGTRMLRITPQAAREARPV
jgi:hypothetical protein